MKYAPETRKNYKKNVFCDDAAKEIFGQLSLTLNQKTDKSWFPPEIKVLKDGSESKKTKTYSRLDGLSRVFLYEKGSDQLSRMVIESRKTEGDPNRTQYFDFDKDCKVRKITASVASGKPISETVYEINEKFCASNARKKGTDFSSTVLSALEKSGPNQPFVATGHIEEALAACAAHFPDAFHPIEPPPSLPAGIKVNR